MTITEHSGNLFEMLSIERYGRRGRPLIFVSHSLGGILVKGALAESMSMPDSDPRVDIKNSCCAVFFFGTPHLGANITSWGSMLGRTISHIPCTPAIHISILEGLKPDSDALWPFARRFNTLIAQRMNGDQGYKIWVGTIQEGHGKTTVTGASGKVHE